MTSLNLNTNEFNFEHLVDAKDYLKRLGIIGYPKTIILDKQMNVRMIEKRFSKSFESEDKAKWKNDLKHEMIKLNYDE